MYNLTNIQNKHVSLFSSISILVIISLILTFLSTYTKNFSPFYKEYCNKKVCLSYSILFIRFLHYMVSAYLSLYYFIFNTQYDLYYLGIYFVIILHWLVANECVLSYWEMTHYVDKYKLGQSNRLHPYIRIFAGNFTEWVMVFLYFLMIINFILVIKRFNYKYYNYLFGISILILQLSIVSKDRIQTLLQ